MVKKLSWDFSDGSDIETAIPNYVTPEGKELGAQLTRFYLGALGDRLDKRCYDCAFRPGTLANGSPFTTMDVLKCLVEEESDFNCHIREGLCAGFEVLKDE